LVLAVLLCFPPVCWEIPNPLVSLLGKRTEGFFPPINGFFLLSPSLFPRFFLAATFFFVFFFFSPWGRIYFLLSAQFLPTMTTKNPLLYYWFQPPLSFSVFPLSTQDMVSFFSKFAVGNLGSFFFFYQTFLFYTI